MTIEELQEFLESSGVPSDSYVIQGLGIGEQNGIGLLNGVWCTYYSERGSYGAIVPYTSQEEAVREFLYILYDILKSEGQELKLPDDLHSREIP